MRRSPYVPTIAMRVAPSLAVAVTALCLAAPASASASASITISPESAAQGEQVTVAGNVPATGSASCSAGASAQLTSTADLFPAGGFGPHAVRDANGDFSVVYTIPASTPAGAYDIGIRCAGGNVGVSATLRVTEPLTSTTTARSTTTLGRSSTTPGAVTTTTVSRSTVPETTTSAPGRGDAGGGALPWVGLGVVVVLLGVAVLVAVRRRRLPARP